MSNFYAKMKQKVSQESKRTLIYKKRDIALMACKGTTKRTAMVKEGRSTGYGMIGF